MTNPKTSIKFTILLTIGIILMTSQMSTAAAFVTGGYASGGTAVSNGGVFEKLLPPIGSVGSNNHQSDNLFAFDEGQNLVSTVPLNVDILASTGSSGTVPAGTYASHYVFFDPGPSRTIQGCVAFDSDIIAVITSKANLDASDIFQDTATTGANYLSPSLRGLEAVDDAFIGAPNEVCVDFTASSPGDYIRVLTEFSPLGEDTDEDGVLDGNDNCPDVPNADQADIDADGTGDACDFCPNDTAKIEPGTCGCGVSDSDEDGDGTADCNDGCPIDPNKTSNGQCGCGIPDTDTDGDGIANCVDICPADPFNDIDTDGICGDIDACPLDPDNDADSDGVCGDVDNCPVTSNADQIDSDGDGVGDTCDNCPDNSNPDQADTDGNGVGDVCDNAAPICDAATVSTESLWPPNHKMRTVTISGISDADGDAIALSINSVTQDEPVDETGDGKTSPDAEINGESVDLRAERSGNGDGRVYEISFTADDGNGAMCTGTVQVGVPHDKKDTPVDSGQNYDSTS